MLAARQQVVVRLLQSQAVRTAAIACARTCTRTTTRNFYSARRPIVRGEAVAFHVKDLVGQNKKSRPLVHHAAAVDYSYDDDDEEPEVSPQFDSDLIVVLDMDECLIHSQFLTNNPAAKFYAHQVSRNQNGSNSSSTTTQRVDSFQFHLPDGDLVQVNKRPYLEDFLQAVCSQYETHIYTAAMQVYAEPILDRLDPHGDRFAKRWYRETCDLDQQMGAYVKNLGRLPLNKSNNSNSSSKNNLTYESYLQRSQQPKTPADHHLRRVVLVDNNPLSFLANPTNGILVSSFYNDPADKTLPAVLDLLKELEPLEDVRPTLDQRFGLKAALSEIQGSRRQQQQQQSTSTTTTSTTAATNGSSLQWTRAAAS